MQDLTLKQTFRKHPSKAGVIPPLGELDRCIVRRMSLEHDRLPPKLLLLGAEHDELSGMTNFVLNMVQEARNQTGITVLWKVRKYSLCQNMLRVIVIRRNLLGGLLSVDSIGMNIDGRLHREGQKRTVRGRKLLRVPNKNSKDRRFPLVELSIKTSSFRWRERSITHHATNVKFGELGFEPPRKIPREITVKVLPAGLSPFR